MARSAPSVSSGSSRGPGRTPGPPRGTAAIAERLPRLRRRRAGLEVCRPTSSSQRPPSGPEPPPAPTSRRRHKRSSAATGASDGRSPARPTSPARTCPRRHPARRPLGAEDRAPCRRSPVAPRDPRRHQPAQAARPAPAHAARYRAAFRCLWKTSGAGRTPERQPARSSGRTGGRALGGVRAAQKAERCSSGRPGEHARLGVTQQALELLTRRFDVGPVARVRLPAPAVAVVVGQVSGPATREDGGAPRRHLVEAGWVVPIDEHRPCRLASRHARAHVAVGAGAGQPCFGAWGAIDEATRRGRSALVGRCATNAPPSSTSLAGCSTRRHRSRIWVWPQP